MIEKKATEITQSKDEKQMNSKLMGKNIHSTKKISEKLFLSAFVYLAIVQFVFANILTKNYKFSEDVQNVTNYFSTLLFFFGLSLLLLFLIYKKRKINRNYLKLFFPIFGIHLIFLIVSLASIPKESGQFIRAVEVDTIRYYYFESLKYIAMFLFLFLGFYFSIRNMINKKKEKSNYPVIPLTVYAITFIVNLIISINLFSDFKFRIEACSMTLFPLMFITITVVSWGNKIWQKICSIISLVIFIILILIFRSTTLEWFLEGYRWWPYCVGLQYLLILFSSILLFLSSLFLGKEK